MQDNWFKEVFLDSDTKVALISGAPSDDERGLVPDQPMKFDARSGSTTPPARGAA
jgi:hypothetical protein